MDTLNDDCQMGIIKMLNIKDQLSLYEAFQDTEYYPNSVITNLVNCWKCERIFDFDEDDFDGFLEKPELLHHFLTTISPSVRELKLYDVNVTRLQSWKDYEFPEMRKLEYTIYSPTEGDKLIQLMSKMFPKLENLQTFGSFDLVHLSKWFTLRKLDLRESFIVFPTTESSKGLEGLQLLQELQIRSSVLTDEELKLFAYLPALRVLITQCTPQQYKLLIGERFKDIEKICLHHFGKSDLSCVQKLHNLRELRLVHVNEKPIAIGDLQNLLSSLPKLEQLDVIGPSQFFKTEKDVLQTIARCPSLKHVNISHPPCTIVNGKRQAHDPNHPDFKDLFAQIMEDHCYGFIAKFYFYDKK